MTWASLLTPVPAAWHGLETALGRMLTPPGLTTVFPLKKTLDISVEGTSPWRLADSSSYERARLSLESYKDAKKKKNVDNDFLKNLSHRGNAADFLFLHLAFYVSHAQKY